MTQEEILEYNKRCAKFLGSELKNDGQYDYWTYDHLGFDSFKISAVSWISGNFEFHSDWNWIMEVANAIEKLAVNQDVINWVRQHKCIFDLKLTEAKKETVVKAINQFLIWYETK